MTLPNGVFTVPLTMTVEDRTAEFTPTAVETDRGLILVDVGFDATLPDLEAGLGDAGYDLADVATVLLTHHDGDHAAGLSTLAERVDPLVAAHREATPYVDGREPPVKGDPDDRYPPVPVDLAVTEGVRFRTAAGPMEVVFTPGHAPGHVSLYFPEERLLLAGDALVAEDGLAGPKPEFTPDVARAAESVERLADLAVETVVCYHGGTATVADGEIASIAASSTK